MEPRMVETRLDELSWLFCIVARVFLVIADFFFFAAEQDSAVCTVLYSVLLDR